ncbi:uncharacterized protein DNG_00207 [Cephalotrichum gorgonifer]|uniref:Uncharacterized protein n=1 Tax=Cephalotrichum gorgonifer TaxID=2041049 RepID=A0AAE8MNV0_9PEZI|nr:uncharacterized protein DNG_00207 [Cephalotrichum gorgonifer]
MSRSPPTGRDACLMPPPPRIRPISRGPSIGREVPRFVPLPRTFAYSGSSVDARQLDPELLGSEFDSAGSGLDLDDSDDSDEYITYVPRKRIKESESGKV